MRQHYDVTNLIRTEVLSFPGVTRRRMFGAEAFFAHGLMFAFLGHHGVVVRLPEPLRSEAIEEGIAFPYLPPGTTDFEGWTEIPFDATGPRAILRIVELAHEHVPAEPVRRKPKAAARPRRRPRATKT